MKVIKKVFLLLITFVLVMGFLSCGSSKSYIVRYDFDSDEIDELYINMPEKEVFELLGLPHRSKTYIDSSSYDYYNESGALRVEFEYLKLKNATFFGKDDATTIRLKEKKTVNIDSDQYLRDIDTSITSDALGFINQEVSSEKVQSILGPPHYYVDYDIGGLLLNAFVYDMKDENKFFIIYKPNGFVGLAQVQNEDGEIVKDIVQFEE